MKDTERKESFGSEDVLQFFSTQPSVKLIKQCIMPLIKSMANR